ncbi:hypothetical protein Acsp06_43810 [Actinomycetospora sp. NBRC 106375]|uniref:DUF6519 domain-containing protein n=1 Tax=Actinomycetospora sp. NBRC 106375 TaxID=3032207 RepID=UPI00249FD058|nr:DUF6519 domain-containing protein [Actinomycetospora sp. NBRC 106375]GLZ48196.1 hypothetical protein Acsp06_43810 [Actinomycetospora sp. NBRC 106375]
MHGDFSRFTFDETRDDRAVLLQQGRVLLDADWNEQAEISARRDEIRSCDLLGRHGGFAGDAGFAVGGASASGVAWSSLRLGAGAYYVDGSRCFLGDAATLATDLELTEPGPSGDHLLYLDTWVHHVTPDEDPTLLEPALGGPDTTTRTRTVWRVRTAKVDADVTTLPTPIASPTRGTMTASLTPGPVDPLDGSPASGRYTRLENQLYRVQIHDDRTTSAQYLWSRENGSVTARVLELTPGAAHDPWTLRIDRAGRDEELSIRQDDLVEVTSADRALDGLPGFLATVGAPDRLQLPLTWLGEPPTPPLTELGAGPIVRRWDGRGTVDDGAAPLESGIEVAFPGGTYRVGDYWLIPARAVRLAYGLADLPGTILWPKDDQDRPLPRTPDGPSHQVAELALLRRSADGKWTVRTDLRRLAPPLPDALTLSVVGGDAQEAPANTPLPQPIRVAAHRGGLPVRGVRVRFTAGAGATVAVAGGTNPGVTGADGTISAQWTLNPATTADSTQTLDIRLDDGTGIPLTVTGRKAITVDQIEREIAELDARLTALKKILTKRGDLYVAQGDGDPVRLGLGAQNQVLTADPNAATGPGVKWATVDQSGKVDKSTLTATGDLYVASSAGTPARLPVGTPNQVLTADPNATAGPRVRWAAVNLDAKVDKSTLTTRGDLYVADNANSPTRLGLGTQNQVLTADPNTAGPGVKWSTLDLSSKVDKSTLTATGDLYVASSAGTPARLPVGNNGDMLMVGSDGNRVRWANLISIRYKTADESRSNGHVINDDAALTFRTGDPVTAGIFVIDGLIVYTTTTTAAWKGRLIHNGSATSRLSVKYLAANTESPNRDFGNGTQFEAAGNVPGQRGVIQVLGTLDSGGFGVDLMLQWSQRSDENTPTTVHAGSFLRLIRVR